MISTTTHGKVSDRRAVIPTRVLVVDEEALVRWSLCTALATEGFDAVSAASVHEARRVASEWPPPRVAIIDSRVPGADDRTLIRTIRDVYPDCRFVILTTAHRGDFHDRNGANRFVVIEKPFDLARVVRLVSDLAHS
jgi:DNA-binding NtrC family response regulator